MANLSEMSYETALVQSYNEITNSFRIEQGTSPASAATDAFSRLRVSNPKGIFDVNFEGGLQPLIFDSAVVGSGSVVHNSNFACASLTTGTSASDSVIFRTRRYLKYHPGKSQLVILSGNLGEKSSAVIKRMGQFDENNGFYFQLTDVLSVCLRSSTSGSPVDRVFDQSDWNIDKLDGTGPSGLNLDITKQNIFIFDYQWLGAGRIRYGFDLGGNIVYCHQIDNANNLGQMYSRTANLPINVEIRNQAIAPVLNMVLFSCCAVISEGAENSQPDGVVRYNSNGITTRTFNTTLYPIISLRKKAAFISTPVQLEQAQCFGTSSDSMEVCVVINGTLTGGSWTDAGGICEINSGATAISGGTQVMGSYLKSSSSAPSIFVERALFESVNVILGRSIVGDSDVVSICVRTFTGSGNGTGSFIYREL